MLYHHSLSRQLRLPRKKNYLDNASKLHVFHLFFRCAFFDHLTLLTLLFLDDGTGTSSSS